MKTFRSNKMQLYQSQTVFVLAECKLYCLNYIIAFNQEQPINQNKYFTQQTLSEQSRQISSYNKCTVCMDVDIIATVYCWNHSVSDSEIVFISIKNK